MKIKPNILVLDETPQPLKVSGYSSFAVSCIADTKGNPGDLIVRVDHIEKRFKGFTDRDIWDKKTNNYPSVVEIYSGSKELPYCFLLGLFKVLFLDLRSKDISECLQLNRRSEDDRGFFQPFTILEYGSHFLLLYEGGIARLSYNGKCEWHTHLLWDDIFERINDRGLIYTNEHTNDGKEWLVAFEDGRVQMCF